MRVGRSEGWNPQNAGVCTWEKWELQFEPRSPKYDQITVLGAHEAKMRFGGGQTGSKRLQMAHGTPFVGSPIVQNNPLACHLLLKVDRWVGLVRFGTVLGRFGPILAFFGPFSVPRANGAILRSKVTSGTCHWGFRSPNKSPIDGLTQGYPPTKFWGSPDGPTRDTEIGPPIGPLACRLLAASSPHKKK